MGDFGSAKARLLRARFCVGDGGIGSTQSRARERAGGRGRWEWTISDRRGPAHWRARFCVGDGGIGSTQSRARERAGGRGRWGWTISDGRRPAHWRARLGVGDGGIGSTQSRERQRAGGRDRWEWAISDRRKPAHWRARFCVGDGGMGSTQTACGSARSFGEDPLTGVRGSVSEPSRGSGTDYSRVWVRGLAWVVGNFRNAPLPVILLRSGGRRVWGRTDLAAETEPLEPICMVASEL